MNEITVSAEGIVGAPPAEVYNHLADYRQHPTFLPRAFSDFRIEVGGTGEGTVVSYRLKAGGRTRSYRATISEPEPGRVLEERLADGDTVTTFTVSPHSSGSTVRIETRWPASRGLKGWLERALAPRMLQPLYTEELSLLDRYARSQREPAHASA